MSRQFCLAKDAQSLTPIQSQHSQNLLRNPGSNDKLEREQSPAPSSSFNDHFSDLTLTPVAGSVGNGAEDPSYRKLHDNIKIIRHATVFSNIDEAYAAYKVIAGISVDFCKDLCKKSR